MTLEEVLLRIQQYDFWVNKTRGLNGQTVTDADVYAIAGISASALGLRIAMNYLVQASQLQPHLLPHVNQYVARLLESKQDITLFHIQMEQLYSSFWYSRNLTLGSKMVCALTCTTREHIKLSE